MAKKKGGSKVPTTKGPPRKGKVMAESPVRIDMPPDLRRMLAEAAAYEGISMSAFLRRLFMDYLRAKGKIK
ncbi:MAG: hypothetical protein JOZ63_17060 [Planctomycetaceae bacterium]|nr:hypothetical protein [Planctomycetaceae bacterium]